MQKTLKTNKQNNNLNNLSKHSTQTRQDEMNPNNIQAPPAAVDLHYMFNPVYVVKDTRVN